MSVCVCVLCGVVTYLCSGLTDGAGDGLSQRKRHREASYLVCACVCVGSR